MQKIFLLFTLLCLSLSARAHDAEVDGIFYNLDAANKTATVTFKGDNFNSYSNEYSGGVVIPETVTYNGITYSVTSLRAFCFYGCSSLTSITIPNSVTSLGDACFFGCSSLTSITIPNSVTSLGRSCFALCRSLTSITIPNSVTSLGDGCFYGCSSIERMVVDAANPVYDSREDCNAIIHTSTNKLIAGCKNSQIPNSVTSLGDGCFAGCSSLASITIPNSVTSLGDRCFSGCSSLTSITIPNSVTSLGDYCFSDCSNLERMVVDAANPVFDSREDCNAIIHTSTNKLIAGCKNSQIPNSVTSLGDYCFHSCRSLTSITIPNSVTSLGNGCFWGCSSLTSISIGNSVTSLGDECFSDCSSLTSITIPNSVTSVGDYCFEGCSSLTSITIPNSVTSLGGYCFSGCRSLTSITIPNSVTSLGLSCFSGCSNLERMVVDAANPVYDSREDCNAIIHTSSNMLIAGCKNSHIPNSVTSLGDECFEGCSSLTSITIPNSVTSLGEQCFRGCSSIERMVVDAANPVYDSREDCNAIIHTSTNELVAGCKNSQIPNSVTSLGKMCFSDCSSLTSITIPNSVTSLGDYCFRDCSSLTSITMLRSTPPSTGDWIFDRTPLKTVYVVDEYAKTAYQAKYPWNEYEIKESRILSPIQISIFASVLRPNVPNTPVLSVDQPKN